MFSYATQVEILFTAVQRLELDTRFTGGLTLAPVSSYRDLNEDSAIPLPHQFSREKRTTARFPPPREQQSSSRAEGSTLP